MTDRAAEAARLAHELIVFCDGMEAGNPQMTPYARRGRRLATETIWLAQEVDAERSSRRLMELQRDEVRIALARLSAKYHLGDPDAGGPATTSADREAV